MTKLPSLRSIFTLQKSLTWNRDAKPFQCLCCEIHQELPKHSRRGDVDIEEWCRDVNENWTENSNSHKSGLERYSGTTPLVCDFSAWFSVSSWFSTPSSFSASHFSASSAATQPEPKSQSALCLHMYACVGTYQRW